MEEAQKDNDFELIRFLKGRFKLLDVNTNVTKNVIELSELEAPDQRAIVILVLMLLKNLNNLILELGELGVNHFLRDLENDFMCGTEKC